MQAVHPALSAGCKAASACWAGEPSKTPVPYQCPVRPPPHSPTCGSHTDRLPAPHNTRVLLPCGLQLTSSSSHSARAGLVSTLPPPSSGGPSSEGPRERHGYIPVDRLHFSGNADNCSFWEVVKFLKQFPDVSPVLHIQVHLYDP